MKQSRNNTQHWVADEGKTFIRKSDNFDMGAEIWLGENDYIENYEEKTIEQEEDNYEQNSRISQ